MMILKKKKKATYGSTESLAALHHKAVLPEAREMVRREGTAGDRCRHGGHWATSRHCYGTPPTMLVSGLAPREGISLFGLAGVPTSGWMNPLLSIKLENKRGKMQGEGGQDAGHGDWTADPLLAQAVNRPRP